MIFFSYDFYRFASLFFYVGVLPPVDNLDHGVVYGSIKLLLIVKGLRYIDKMVRIVVINPHVIRAWLD